MGSLIVAEKGGNGGLVYAGVVGTGFSARSEVSLEKTLRKKHRKTCPLKRIASDPRPLQGMPRNVEPRWVTPRLIVEVEYRQWTRDGLRHGC